MNINLPPRPTINPMFLMSLALCVMALLCYLWSIQIGGNFFMWCVGTLFAIVGLGLFLESTEGVED